MRKPRARAQAAKAAALSPASLPKTDPDIRPVPPGLMIALAVLGINFVGDGLRDALDPRMRLD